MFKNSVFFKKYVFQFFSSKIILSEIDFYYFELIKNDYIFFELLDDGCALLETELTLDTYLDCYEQLDLFEDEKIKYFNFLLKNSTYNYMLVEKDKKLIRLFNKIINKKIYFFKFFLNWLFFISEKNIFYHVS